MLERYIEAKNVKLPNELLTYARELDRHYIPSRYPNAHPAGSPHEAYDESTSKRTLEAAEAILNFVKGLI